MKLVKRLAINDRSTEKSAYVLSLCKESFPLLRTSSEVITIVNVNADSSEILNLTLKN